jgi:hypothetical protein
LKRVVNVTTLRPHACQSTRSWRARTTRLEARIRRPSPDPRSDTEGLAASERSADA